MYTDAPGCYNSFMGRDLPPGARFFSLEEARRMLPLVRRIAEDIAAHWQELEPHIVRLRSMPPEARRTADGKALEEELEARSAEMDALISELQDLGCYFKGVQEGLVDWYSLYKARPVFLCWRLGEPEIAWWHQVDAGFAGRQRILDSQRSAFRGDE
ncbi:MAG: DUF2203 family protein [Gemmatimonas sp.]|nr:DUF2203 family protein [Gemmatimonas sp.]